jgi:hypothetical protein
MRRLAIKGGFLWFLFALVPIASITNIVGKIIHLDTNIILAIQIPALTFQVFSLVVMIKYNDEIFNGE